MYQTFHLMPGVTLRCVEAHRFKQGCLSIQFLRPMCWEEVGLNALIPSILLRGTVRHPDIRAITQHLDDLYGAALSDRIRRIGDYQTVGLYLRFVEDRFTLSGDRVLERVLDFTKELLLEPLTEDGGFCPDYVAGEKRNMIANIEGQLNDKQAYASARLMEKMCSADSFGIPRLGTRETIEAVDPISAYRHYCRILSESPVEVFYVGSADQSIIADKIREIFSSVERNPITLADHSQFHDGGGGDYTETMEISQGKLCMGFVTPITTDSEAFAAMQVLNALFGAGMNSKLFNQIREKMSLCYSIGSSYYGGKGLMTVSAGIDSDQHDRVKQEILNQLRLCGEGEITETELTSAKQAMISALKAVYDGPGSIESYEFVMAVSKMPMTPEEYEQQIQAVTMDQVTEAAKTLSLHTTFFLKGVEA